MGALVLTQPPENGIVRIFRKAIPFIAALDYAVLGVIVLRFVVTLFVRNSAAWVEDSWAWLYEMFPAGGVLMTGLVATGLITSQLSSLDADMGDLATIQDKTAQTERRTYLTEQRNICRGQRKQSIAFVMLYAVLASFPQLFKLDVNDGWSRAFLLVLIIGEMMVPLLNMRTFTIVEQSLQKLDVIRNVIYASNNAAQHVLDGIAQRAASGAISRQDMGSLRAGRKGDVNRMLSQREGKPATRLQDTKYFSLRSAVTGIADKTPLTAELKKRYDRALAIARRYRDSENPEWLAQFARGEHNLLLVTERMAGIIIADLQAVRIRPPRNVKEEPIVLAQPGDNEDVA
jgi:hypothetical protein